MPAPEPARDPSTRAQSVGATLGVIVLIAVVVVAALLLSRGGKDSGDSADPASETTRPAGEGSTLDLPTISTEDFPTEAPTRVPSLPTGHSSAPPAGEPTGSDLPDLSGFPTNPSDYESWFTDNLEQMNR